MNRFDPETEREIVIALRLPMLNFQPWLQSPTRIARHAHQSVKDLVPCYLVGLADAARPKLQAILGWMEGQLPPHLGVWSPRTEHWHAGRTHHRWWWQSVAVCRWLLHDDRGETDFARAVEVEHEGWTQAPGDALEFEQPDLEMTLPKLLPMALSGGRPALGVALDALCTERDPDWGARPALEFGRWACTHLVNGGHRDADFVARGEDMLQRTVEPYFQYMPGLGEAALWLKAIYFDSGVTKTAEETMLRVYDFMPGVSRPDFAPG